eukprot:3201366-Rhodomonas_salina.3
MASTDEGLLPAMAVDETRIVPSTGRSLISVKYRDMATDCEPTLDGESAAPRFCSIAAEIANESNCFCIVPTDIVTCCDRPSEVGFPTPEIERRTTASRDNAVGTRMVTKSGEVALTEQETRTPSTDALQASTLLSNRITARIQILQALGIGGLARNPDNTEGSIVNACEKPGDQDADRREPWHGTAVWVLKERPLATSNGQGLAVHFHRSVREVRVQTRGAVEIQAGKGGEHRVEPHSYDTIELNFQASAIKRNFLVRCHVDLHKKLTTRKDLTTVQGLNRHPAGQPFCGLDVQFDRRHRVHRPPFPTNVQCSLHDEFSTRSCESRPVDDGTDSDGDGTGNDGARFVVLEYQHATVDRRKIQTRCIRAEGVEREAEKRRKGDQHRGPRNQGVLQRK